MTTEKTPKPARPRLAARLDGKPLPEEDARALWKEFSEHMDAYEGDLAGFAKQKGWTAVAPEYAHGQAILVARTTAEAARPAAAAGKKRGR